MLNKRGPFLLALSETLLLALVLLPVHASSTMMQQNSGGCFGCSSTLSLAFANGVTSGNVIVIGVVIADASFTVASVTDTLGSSFTQAVASTNTSTPIVYIYYAILSSSGHDIVTVSFSAAAPAQSVYLYEVSSVTTVGVATATGSGTGMSISTSSPASFQTGAFLLGVIGTNSMRGSASPGAGFILSPDNSGLGVAYAQYSISGAPAQTNFQASTNSSVNWVEDGIALQPNLT